MNFRKEDYPFETNRNVFYRKLKPENHPDISLDEEEMGKFCIDIWKKNEFTPNLESLENVVEASQQNISKLNIKVDELLEIIQFLLNWKSAGPIKYIISS